MIFLPLVVLMTAQAFDWQGHRGARGLYPENTIGAMRVALTYPLITTLELDVVISADGEVVVSHEPWLAEEICVGAKAKETNLYKLSYQEIAKFDCGSKPHPRFPRQKNVRETKPLLKTLLTEVNKLRPTIPYNIEIKSLPENEQAGYQPSIDVFTDMVIQTIQSVMSLERVHIQSFDWRVLRYLHSRYPTVKTVALTEKENVSAIDVTKALGFTPTVFSPHYKTITVDSVKAFQQAQMKVIPWTVNGASDMNKLVEMGVDGIITDYPDLIFPVPH